MHIAYAPAFNAAWRARDGVGDWVRKLNSLIRAGLGRGLSLIWGCLIAPTPLEPCPGLLGPGHQNYPDNLWWLTKNIIINSTGIFLVSSNFVEREYNWTHFDIAVWSGSILSCFYSWSNWICLCQWAPRQNQIEQWHIFPIVFVFALCYSIFLWIWTWFSSMAIVAAFVFVS